MMAQEIFPVENSHIMPKYGYDILEPLEQIRFLSPTGIGNITPDSSKGNSFNRIFQLPYLRLITETFYVDGDLCGPMKPISRGNVKMLSDLLGRSIANDLEMIYRDFERLVSEGRFDNEVEVPYPDRDFTASVKSVFNQAVAINTNLKPSWLKGLDLAMKLYNTGIVKPRLLTLKDMYPDQHL